VNFWEYNNRNLTFLWKFGFSRKTLDGSAFIVYLTLAFNILTPAKAILKLLIP
jgi:hypothetical protein